MAAPLLGLASLIGREYANTMPTNRERNEVLKLVSPHTYYGNQLIEYLANRIDPDLGYGLETARLETDSDATYPYAKGISQEEYNQQMADLNASTNRPGAIDRFENYLRDADYGTIIPNAQNFTGPQTEDSQAFQFGSDTFPVTVGQLPVESNFTPLQLEALERALVGGGFEVGPQPDVPDTPRRPDFTPEGSGSGFMPQGGDFMPGGYEKNPFETSYEDVEQYLRGGVVGRRRA
jgi:hypothetical protein